MIISSFVYVRLPRVGLGNKLLVWARGLVFSHVNNLPLYTSSWNHFALGSWLRREHEKRVYQGYFRERRIPLWFNLLSIATHKWIYNPPIVPIQFAGQHSKYIFNELPHWSDIFDCTKEFRNLIRTQLWEMLAPSIKRQVKGRVSPVVSLHIRMGDFRPLQEDETFAEVGAVRTPLSYFSELIDGIRSVHGSSLPITIFSDGHDEELMPILVLPDVQRATRSPAIVDLLLMSQSQLIICSAGSTFSYWAGFLADAPVLLHPDHIHKPLRPDEVNQYFFEGGVRGSILDWPDLLKRNISMIRP